MSVWFNPELTLDPPQKFQEFLGGGVLHKDIFDSMGDAEYRPFHEVHNPVTTSPTSVGGIVDARILDVRITPL